MREKKSVQKSAETKLMDKQPKVLSRWNKLTDELIT